MMDQTLYKKMATFQKTACENTFVAMDKIHEQSESMMNVFFNQAAWMPEENKKIFKEWSKGCRAARHQFKGMVDEGFHSFEDWMETLNTEKKAPPSKTAKV